MSRKKAKYFNGGELYSSIIMILYLCACRFSCFSLLFFTVFCRYVRQGVLFALSMLIAVTPPHFLDELMRGAGLSEAVLWVGQLCQNEADAECRSLAQHTLALLNAAMKPDR